MQRPVIYIGFGGGDLANYWPASFVAAVVNAGQLLVDGDLTPQFRYFNTARPLNYEVAVVGGGGTTPKGPLGHVFYGPFRGPIT